ncbi:hypothetical protein TREMEDRAFT_42766, partial [Tremella mesenterica DSM 1558]|uniref:uncharacterized protein n=1 Tax=Tremella mesenterica (strain ATCC 24925 / CBS 8224 / DSM 1558 / NBRC 9311 / NRRL Y-6157 / RJB 2259-6 / UBC 559-6) TaxID=578456 RepID=UPI0003F492CD
MATFQSLTPTNTYVLGFEEPDCYTTGSSGIDVGAAAGVWNSVIAPWKAAGATLISPGMCKQADETWLGPFQKLINVDWDVTALHINKLDMAGVQLDLDHYWQAYGKPMIVTEFACVDDQNGFIPCSDQGQINTFINQIVDLLQNDGRVIGYMMSAGEGLGNVWPPWNADGSLSESGQTYLNAISKY